MKIMKTFSIYVYSVLIFLILGACLSIVSLLNQQTNDYFLLPTISFIVLLYFTIKFIKGIKNDEIYRIKKIVPKIVFYVFFLASSIITGVGGVFALLSTKDDNLFFALFLGIPLLYFAHCLMSITLMYRKVSKN